MNDFERLKDMDYQVEPDPDCKGYIIVSSPRGVVIRYDTAKNEVTGIFCQTHDDNFDCEDLCTIIDEIQNEEDMLTHLGFRFSKDYRPAALAKAEQALYIAQITDDSYIAFGYVTAAHELLHWLSLNGYPCDDLHRQLNEAMDRIERMNR